MSRLRPWLPVVIVLLAAALRLHALDAQSFWNDEGNSARLSERSLRLILEGTASDVHPPLYYLILRGWRELAGATDFTLRLVSAYAGVVLVAVVWRIGRFWPASAGHATGAIDWKSVADKQNALKRVEPPPVNRFHGWTAIAALWVALSPPLVWYSQEARMYSMLVLLAWLATLILLRGLARPTWPRTLALLLTLTAGLYTHYFFPIVIALHGGLVLWHGPADWAAVRRRVGSWLGVVAAALLLYAPWLALVADGLGGNRGVPQTAGAFAGGIGRFLLTGHTWQWSAWQTALWFALLVTVTGLALWQWRRMAPLLWWLLLPLVALWLVGATDPTFYKFALLVIPALALLAGRVGVWVWGDRPMLRLPLALVALALVALTLSSLREMHHNPRYARADYRGIAARIATEAHPAAGIILNAPNQWEVFTWYHRQGAAVYPVPRSRDRATIEAELAAIAAQHTRLYALFWGEGQQDPDGIVEQWLDAHTFRAREEWVGDVRFVQFAVAGESADLPTVTLDLLFGDQVRLTGYALPGSAFRAGDAIPLTLFWEATGPISTDWKVFVHLLDSDGAIAGQRDTAPWPPMTAWQPGERQAGRYGVLVNPDTPPGRYTLVAGLYDWLEPGRRLKSADGRDTIVLEQLIIDN